MNAENFGAQALPYNPHVLKWAREWRGRSVDEAAQKVSVESERLLSWESGDAIPTVRQARALAAFYDRSFLEFFLSRHPNVPESQLVPDFRVHRKASDPRGDREIKAVQDWASDTRQNALDLFALTSESVPLIPPAFTATTASNPELVAMEARRLFGLSIESQLGLKSADRGRVSKDIRHAMERLGILVLKDSSLSKYHVRGLSLFAEPLPVVVFGAEAPTAQSFTLAHELGHVALRQSEASRVFRRRFGLSHATISSSCLAA